MSEERNERCIDWRIKMLEVGTKAPDFELPDQNGELHKLSEYLGKKVILYFIQGIIHLDVQSRLVDFQIDTHSLLRKVRLYLA